MKTLLTKCLLGLFVLALFQSCASAPKKPVKTQSQRFYEKLGNFDKVYIPNEAPLISQMISIVQPELEDNERNKIANDIHHAIRLHKVEPQIIVALIDTESDFQYQKVSSTGDLSLGQINVDVWNEEFARMKIPLIDKSKLTTEDQSYAMEVMAQILHILKHRYGKKDRRWYARYHSNTKKYKMAYLKKIEVRMKLLAQAKEHLTTQKSLALSSQNSP
jgi:hypothetical protein